MLPNKLYMAIWQEFNSIRTFDDYEEAKSFVRNKGVIETFTKSGNYYVQSDFEVVGPTGRGEHRSISSQFGIFLQNKRTTAFNVKCFFNLVPSVMEKFKNITGE